ncbi:type II secretion system ATPase GspE [Desulfurobacterium thermolithotrophum]|uniref:type II secretion system ATPase GspE n=1 Tax=Desulfurobacterium thermolithotrophum TaxID=64160 RepID=UPI0013CFBD82|nr:type II secretion system ATPase GspE [Desulfurobacterium thermolithotrophum]
MLSEKIFLKKLKEEELIPNKDFSSFKEVVGILRWENPKLKSLFEELGFPFLEKIPQPQREVLEKVSPSFLRKERLIPLEEDENEVEVATDNPFNLEGIKKIEWIFAKPIKIVVIPFDEVNKFLMAKEETEEKEEIIDQYGEDILTVQEEAPTIQLINDILMTAVRIKASDIHFEPFKDRMRVRLRIDGVLKTLKEIPPSKIPSVVSRLKIMANLDIAEKRLPQDGRIMIKVGGKEVDIRVSTLPTYFGERVVLRLLSKESILYSTKELGLLDKEYKKFKKLIHTPHGIILVTGPTGSGKTTTLYAALSEINSEEINVITVEDPVEYQLDGISQVQVKPDIGLTFASALRSILRQDPDVIMIGEIRDIETAEIAIQSALTGHLVFSTLHTNDSATSVTRLLDMGIEPFLVASSVIGVIAQRLVRKICPHCKTSYKPTDEELREIGLTNFEGKLFKGAGCEHCMGTGYLGRTAIYEILVVDKEIRSAVLESKDADVIKNLAVKKGMKTLRMDGAEKVKLGITTIEEVLRVTRG